MLFTECAYCAFRLNINANPSTAHILPSILGAISIIDVLPDKSRTVDHQKAADNQD